jgi:hypothetical protein
MNPLMRATLFAIFSSAAEATLSNALKPARFQVAAATSLQTPERHTNVNQRAARSTTQIFMTFWLERWRREGSLAAGTLRQF